MSCDANPPGYEAQAGWKLPVHSGTHAQDTILGDFASDSSHLKIIVFIKLVSVQGFSCVIYE